MNKNYSIPLFCIELKRTNEYPRKYMLIYNIFQLFWLIKNKLQSDGGKMLRCHAYFMLCIFYCNFFAKLMI